jgi:putative transcriptional regulator
MSNLGDDLIEAMQEAAAYMQGDPGKTVTSTVDVPDVDVAAIRRTMRLSRIKFANRFGLDARAVQDWEQGRRRPDRSARILLRVIEKHPEAVEDALKVA